MSDGPLPRMHPREVIVRKAEHELSIRFEALINESKLTEAEALRVIHSTYMTFTSSVIRLAIRTERHGNTDKPGGIE